MSFSSHNKMNFLKNLNTQQLKAVTAPANGILQIIAGPGTGKTKVLTSRVAFLLISEKIKPEHIIVTTFTKKAANEMIERLEKILENTNIDITRLLIGTFHSICFKIIKKYGFKMGLSDFTIADERDKDHYIKEVLTKELTKAVLNYINNTPKELDLIRSKSSNEKYHDIDLNKLKRQISRLKSSGYLPDEYKILPNSNRILYFIYEAYQRKLQEVEKKLDFDDCLLYCHKLITKYPLLHFIKHVLVDEFQDTNKIQLHLMYAFAKGHIADTKFQNNVTIVGDPDQSIYGFRDAQTINFKSMKEYYANKDLKCEIITLNDNYRSTNDILDFSELVMKQEPDRVTKQLTSQFTTSIKPVFKSANSPENEAKKIVYEIKYLLSLPSQPIKPNDIAILVRSGFQSSVIEKELVSQKLPYHMIRGRAFWDRKEVVAIMDYLKACGDPNDRISIMRTLNYPKRGIGAKTLEKIEDAIIKSKKDLKMTPRETLRALADNKHKVEKLAPKVRSSLSSYLNVIEGGEKLLPENNTDSRKPSEIINQELFDFVYSQSGLEKEYKSDEEQNRIMIENIEEIRRQFNEFKTGDDRWYDASSDEEEEEEEEVEELENRNTIIQFIESIGLYESSDGGANEYDENNESKTPKISLSTIHGSKGLEWPVVFVPGLTEGILPAKYASGETAVDEERRCFYVAVTRAKVLLYVTNYIETSFNMWRQNYDQASRFIKELSSQNYFEERQACFENSKNLEILYKLLGNDDPQLEGFDCVNFFKGYKKNWTSFGRGAPFSTDYGGSSSSDLGGFSSASSNLSSTSKNKKRKFSASTTVQLSDRHSDPIIVTSNNTNQHVIRPNSSSSSGSNDNKAPAYTPVRKGSSKKLGMKR
ncbi:srs2 [Candida pseudojiufengensis]|uniref:srs2 n=1 Tax=Candida pseudojiufengensis TaxID=497109 RepID=UPI00222414B7|nr:srs2 [Candida pseudojiufengensis]KAI5960988.1 srs2 [Candida pseudojiufengensis]